MARVEVKDLVKSLRTRIGISQESLAKASGGVLSREVVTKIELGKNKASTYRIREGLATAFGVSQHQMAAYLDGQMPIDELLAHRESRSANMTNAGHGAAPSSRLCDRGDEWETAVKDAAEFAPYIPEEFFTRAGRFLDDPSVPRPIDGQFVADLALGLYKLSLRMQRQEQVGSDTTKAETSKKRAR